MLENMDKHVKKMTNCEVCLTPYILEIQPRNYEVMMKEHPHNDIHEFDTNVNVMTTKTVKAIYCISFLGYVITRNGIFR